METKDILYLIVGFVGFVIGLIFLSNIVGQKECYEMYTQYQPQYSFWGGCKVEWKGKLTPVGIIRDIQ